MSHIDNNTATTNPIYTYKANWCFCLTLQSTHVHTFKRRCKFWQNYKLASQGIICSDTDLIVIYIFSQSSTQNHSAASNIVKPLLEFSLASIFISLLCFINYHILTEKKQENKINTELQESWLIIQWWIRNFKNDYQKLLIFFFHFLGVTFSDYAFWRSLNKVRNTWTRFWMLMNSWNAFTLLFTQMTQSQEQSLSGIVNNW